MERVGIFEAKSRLSELVERAEAGGEVTITRHGKAVAKIVPVRQQLGHDAPERHASLLLGRSAVADRAILGEAIHQALNVGAVQQIHDRAQQRVRLMAAPAVRALGIRHILHCPAPEAPAIERAETILRASSLSAAKSCG